MWFVKADQVLARGKTFAGLFSWPSGYHVGRSLLGEYIAGRGTTSDGSSCASSQCNK